MQFLVYGRDRPGSLPLKLSRTPDHWSFMDTYADRLIARGPTLTGGGEDAEPTGSLHIVDLPDAQAAHAFAYDEPYYRAGVFASVLLCRFTNTSGRTMGDFTGAVEGHGRFLVLAWGRPQAPPTPTKNLIVYGDLHTLDGDAFLGRAALTEAPSREAAASALPTTGEDRTEVHSWRFGGRPGR